VGKEFNIDDYQYVEEHISLTEWLQGYKIQPNHLNHDADFSGLLYRHEGAEWDYVVRLPNQQQWTLVRGDDGELFIKNGLTVKGRLGYFIGSNLHNSHGTMIVDGITDAAYETKVCGG